MPGEKRRYWNDWAALDVAVTLDDTADLGVGFGIEQQIVTFALAISTDGQGGDTDAGILEGDFIRKNARQFQGAFFQGLAFTGDADLGAALTFEHGLNPERMAGDAAINLGVAVGVILQVVQFDHLDEFAHGCPLLITL